MHEEAILAAVDQGRLAKRLKVLRRIGDGQPHLGGQRIDRALALREQLEHLEPMRIRQGLADAGEQTIEAILEDAMRRPFHASNQ